MGIDPKLRESLVNHLKGRFDVEEFSEQQQQWIDLMAEQPELFLGAAGGGIGTPKEVIVERLIDQFSDLIEKETDPEQTRPYLEAGIESAEEIQKLQQGDIPADVAGMSVSPEDLEELGMSEIEAKKLLIDYNADMSVAKLFLDDHLSYDQVQELSDDG